MTRYLSLDAEFSGLSPWKHSLLSLGLVEVDPVRWRVLADRQLYLELRPLTPYRDPEAMRINGLDWEHLRTQGLTPVAACHRIADWLDLRAGDDAVLVTYCGVLDKVFLDMVYEHAGLSSPFHYELVELSSLAIGRLGLRWGFSEADLEQRLGLYPLATGKHNALVDAHHQAEEFVALMRVPVTQHFTLG